ncbi:Clavaminate synthase-like protein [Obba rivulosa]|uniref:Clavaminate synthase-like protein n=1 Tax=Obba rivulosa TaxID=1052685 RepID=A0A8E2AVW4_9APHY|nr:Clavaminate synthase-like protein [Obba rivulosa]
MSNFSSIPILDYALLSSPATRPAFIAQLRHALINVGFLYLAHAPVAPADVAAVAAYAPRLFALPQADKDALRMARSPHFFGYSRVGAELTKGRTDQREQFDFGTPCAAAVPTDARDVEEKPYLRLWGPAQWPAEDVLPGFRAVFERYLAQVEALSFEFVDLLAEALGLAPGALAQCFHDPAPDSARTEDGPARARLQHRAKVVKYPPRAPGEGDQGVGPHFDGSFLTFLLQASPHAGLQVQNLSGAWIDAPPIPGTFVVNIGKALETVTQGLARATSHRVLSPPPGSTPRYSVPFFQNIAQDVCVGDVRLEFPEEILKLKDERGALAATDSVNYAEYNELPSGLVNLIGRVKSHPDVAERHYPDLFKQFFPDGMPLQGSAY